MEQTEIIIRPVISEKSLNRAGASWYTFAVKTAASKPQIKQAIETAFKVNVLTVKTMIVKGKTRRAGKKMKTIKTSSWKKAIVFLPKEQKIDLFEVQGTENQAAVAPAKASTAKKGENK